MSFQFAGVSLCSGRIRLLFAFVTCVTCLLQAGSVNGQVVEMGFHSTQLLNSDKYPTVVPNSYFSNQVVSGFSQLSIVKLINSF